MLPKRPCFDLLAPHDRQTRGSRIFQRTADQNRLRLSALGSAQSGRCYTSFLRARRRTEARRLSALGCGGTLACLKFAVLGLSAPKASEQRTGREPRLLRGRTGAGRPRRRTEARQKQDRSALGINGYFGTGESGRCRVGASQVLDFGARLPESRLDYLEPPDL